MTAFCARRFNYRNDIEQKIHFGLATDISGFPNHNWTMDFKNC